MDEDPTDEVLATIDYLSALAVFLRARVPQAVQNTEDYQVADLELLQSFRERTAHVLLTTPGEDSREASSGNPAQIFVHELIRALRDQLPPDPSRWSGESGGQRPSAG